MLYDSQWININNFFMYWFTSCTANTNWNVLSTNKKNQSSYTNIISRNQITFILSTDCDTFSVCFDSNLQSLQFLTTFHFNFNNFYEKIQINMQCNLTINFSPIKNNIQSIFTPIWALKITLAVCETTYSPSRYFF